jgi:hypothetical protein
VKILQTVSSQAAFKENSSVEESVSSFKMKMHGALPLFDSNVLKIVCISDTHAEDPRESVPPGDILIHTGDMTDNSTIAEFEDLLDWVGSLPHRVKILVAGNI